MKRERGKKGKGERKREGWARCRDESLSRSQLLYTVLFSRRQLCCAHDVHKRINMFTHVKLYVWFLKGETTFAASEIRPSDTHAGLAKVWSLIRATLHDVGGFDHTLLYKRIPGEYMYTYIWQYIFIKSTIHLMFVKDMIKLYETLSYIFICFELPKIIKIKIN